MGVPKTSDHMQIKMKMPNPSQECSVSSYAPDWDLKDTDFFSPSKSRKRAKLFKFGVLKTRDQIHIKIKMPKPSGEPPVS